MAKIWVIGIGPGGPEQMTGEARRCLEECQVIVGYTVYLDLLRESFPEKIYLSTPMRKEEARCRMAFEEAEKGRKTAMVCSGDPGVYGMAGLMYEVGRDYPRVEIQVIPGVTAALGGSALLGAPLGHDFCVISLSDLLTPWEMIEKRFCPLSLQSCQPDAQRPSGPGLPDPVAVPGAGDSLRPGPVHRAGRRGDPASLPGGT